VALVCAADKGCYEATACDGDEQCLASAAGPVFCSACDSVAVAEGEPDVDLCTLTTCQQVSEVFSALRTANKACVETADCALTSDNFDYTCDCGDVVHSGKLDAIATLLAHWKSLGCDPDCGADGADCGFCDCEPPTGAECDGGVCKPVWP